MKINNLRVLNPLVFVTLALLAMSSIARAETSEDAGGVTTVSATKIAKNSALLTGTFTSGSIFRTMAWGLAGKGFTANCGPIGSKKSLTNSCTASPLTCGTTYDYHALELRSDNSSAMGKNLSFTTAACK